MPTARRLVMNLECRHPESMARLGAWDLTVPALCSIEDGSIRYWLDGKIPSSAHLSLSVSHPVRRAAWDDALYYTEPPQTVQSFIDYTKRFPSIEDLIQRTETVISAQRIRAHAETLSRQVKASRPVAPGNAATTHPLTGEFLSPGTGSDEVPFRFATMYRHWTGVDAKELYDFTIAFGKPDANVFLKEMFAGADPGFNDVAKLDEAILTLARTRDVALFKEIVDTWNSEQALMLNFGDQGRLVTDEGIDGYKAAVEWCDDFVRSAMQLEDAVKDFLFRRDAN